MKLHDIHIRDPFVLLHDEKYYMFGTRCEHGNHGHDHAHKVAERLGFDVYCSDDLKEWNGPSVAFEKPGHFWADRDYWAPEVFHYKGRFYMFASVKSDAKCRGTQVFVSDHPAGPFAVHSEKPVTLEDWECLDGTLYIARDGVPYMVFCHEWLQVKDGEMCAIRLTEDLRAADGEPFLLFRASEPVWSLNGGENFITEGPFMHRMKTGELLLLWSSVTKDGYAEAIAVSDNGEIDGIWSHQSELLFTDDGGHGMIFTSREGEMMFTMHLPNKSPFERPVISRIAECGGTMRLLSDTDVS